LKHKVTSAHTCFYHFIKRWRLTTITGDVVWIHYYHHVHILISATILLSLRLRHETKKIQTMSVTLWEQYPPCNNRLREGVDQTTCPRQLQCHPCDSMIEMLTVRSVILKNLGHKFVIYQDNKVITVDP
jgi:hypothetical protein